MIKKLIHPIWYANTKVFCDGKLIFITGSTKSELYIAIWSGNHPFYTNSQKIIDSEGRVSRFVKKYGFKSPLN
jgi:large subunit ribosomal protein L31